MFQVRFHGWDGQALAIAAEVLSIAAFREGHHAQALPGPGVERPGAPAVTSCRIAARPVRGHDPVEAPDAVVVLDTGVLSEVAVGAGLRPDGYLLVDSMSSPESLGLRPVIDAGVPSEHVVTVPAAAIARRGRVASHPAAPLLGGLAALTGVVSVVGLTDVLRLRFPGPAGAAGATAAELAAADVWSRPLAPTGA